MRKIYKAYYEKPIVIYAYSKKELYAKCSAIGVGDSCPTKVFRMLSGVVGKSLQLQKTKGLRGWRI